MILIHVIPPKQHSGGCLFYVVILLRISYRRSKITSLNYIPDKVHPAGGANLIKQLWNIVFQLWTFRNNALHKSDKIHLLSSKELLKEAISSELVWRPLDLPHVFRGYFSHPTIILLLKSITYLKPWC